jgi:hypothetical protein
VVKAFGRGFLLPLSIALSIALALAGRPALAQQDVVVSASVDRPTIRENESFTYLLRAEGRPSGDPDVSAVEQQFDILNQSTTTRIQSINGRTQQVAEWAFQLMPRSTGTFTLPAIQVGNALSNEVTIEILPAPVASDALADIFMETEVDRERVYVQAQVVYTLRLFVGVSTGRATLTAPPIGGGEAIVERLGEDQQYQVLRGGRTFIVRERRYAIFPQQAGALTIGPATYEAMVIPNRGFSRVQRLRSDPVDIEVLPAVAPPPEYAGAAWLPASSLELSESWADNVDEFSLGIPRTRTLTIEAAGLLETQLPELELGDAQGIRQYPDQPELDREVTDTGLRARRVERYAVIAQDLGLAKIPAAMLPWWNVDTETWEVARVAAEEIPVGPSAEPAVAPEVVTPTPAVATEAVPATNYWPIVSALLGVAWLATISLWLRSRGGLVIARKRRARRPSAPRAPSSRRALRELRAASAANDAQRTHALLLEWAKLQFADDPPQSLGALAARLPDSIGAEVAALEAHLYGPGHETWDGGGLVEALASVDAVSRAAASDGKDPLVPLYR